MDKKIILVIGLLIIILVVIFFWKKSSSTLSVNLSKGYSSVEEPELIKKNQVNNIINQREDEPELNDNKIPSPFIDKDDQEPELIKVIRLRKFLSIIIKRIAGLRLMARFIMLQIL